MDIIWSQIDKALGTWIWMDHAHYYLDFLSFSGISISRLLLMCLDLLISGPESFSETKQKSISERTPSPPKHWSIARRNPGSGLKCNHKISFLLVAF